MAVRVEKTYLSQTFFVLFVLTSWLLMSCNRDNGGGGDGGGNVATTPNSYCLNQPPGTNGCQGYINNPYIQGYPYGQGGVFGQPGYYGGCNTFGNGYAPIYGQQQGLGCINMQTLPYPYNQTWSWGNINWWQYGGGYNFGYYPGYGNYNGMLRYCRVGSVMDCGGVGFCRPMGYSYGYGICTF